MERAAILAEAHSERFCDKSVYEIYATLLDEGTYLGSISTHYRTIRAEGETRERRAVAKHPTMVKPELAASAPNQLWSWDITKVLGPQKWTYFYLYVVLDVFSRYVVAWRLEIREDSRMATDLFETAMEGHDVNPDFLTVHSDGGSAMTSKLLTQLFADLGVTKSRSRPHVSNDNPFSEAQFKTVKYDSNYPEAFANIHQGRAYFESFFKWYNTEHRHTGIALLTPEDVHFNRVDEKQAKRAAVLEAAWIRKPERFVQGQPRPPQLQPVVFINPPEDQAA